MADALSCHHHRQQVFPRSAILAMAAAAAATARDDASNAQPALCNISLLAALPVSGALMQTAFILELGSASGALVFSSQLSAQRTAHLSSMVHSTGLVSPPWFSSNCTFRMLTKLDLQSTGLSQSHAWYMPP
jgi:hypothetical protein